MSPFELPQQIPSSAFGDGSHPTTVLTARALDVLCRQRRPTAVLDVGTGTGVLARIARKNGVSFVVGTDIDLPSLEVARLNAALDASPIPIVFSTEEPDTWGPKFDLVVANILEDVLIQLAPLVCKALVPGGYLLMSGFTPIQIPAIETAYSRYGMLRDTHSKSGEWSILLMKKSTESTVQTLDSSLLPMG